MPKTFNDKYKDYIMNYRPGHEYDEEIAHLMQLIRQHKRRLRILEIKEAKQGQDVRPEVYMEIEDIKEKIDGIEKKILGLNTLNQSKNREYSENLVDRKQKAPTFLKWWSDKVGLRPLFELDYNDSPFSHGWNHYAGTNDEKCLNLSTDSLLNETILHKTGGFLNAVSYPVIGTWLKSREPIYILPVKPEETFHIYFNVLTASYGSSYLIYTDSGFDGMNTYNEREVVIKSRSLFNGSWHSLVFNIAEDVMAFLGVQFIHLNWICLRGNLRLSEMIAVSESEVLERVWQGLKSPYIIKG